MINQNEAKVLKINPAIPREIIATSLIIQNSFGMQPRHFLFGCFQNVNICISGGNASARALLAHPPTTVIRH